MANDANDVGNAAVNAPDTEAGRVAATDAPIGIADSSSVQTAQPTAPLQPTTSTTTQRHRTQLSNTCEESTDRDNEGLAAWKIRAAHRKTAVLAPTPMVSSRDWTVEELVKRGGKNFEPIRRVSAIETSPEDLRCIFEDHEKSGIPLIVGDWHKRPDWPEQLFNVDWLLEHGDPSMFSPIYSRVVI